MSIESKIKNTIYGLKSLDLKVEDVDTSSRKVKFYLSSFDTLDSDMDVIRKGAFKESLKQRGVESTGNRKIQYLRHHDWHHQIGKFLQLEEDNYGLLAVGQLSNSTQGNDALIDYNEGVILEHSIGFNYVKNGIKEEEDSTYGKYYNITEVKLFEGSAVTLGANENTHVVDIMKGAFNIDYLDKLNNDMNILVKALRNGKGTDERLENIDLKLKQIQQIYNSLILKKPSIKDTFEKDEPKQTQKEVQKALEDEQLKKLLLKNLIH